MARFGLFKRPPEEERTLDRDSAAPLLTNSVIGEGPSPTGALQIADAFACVRAISDTAASLPLHVYRKTANGRERAGGRADSLLDRPAPACTTSALIGQMLAHLNLWGNCYVGKYREDGEIVRLGLIPPDRVRPELRRGEPVYSVSTEKGILELGTGDIIHVKALSVDGLVGLSPVTQARTALGLSSSLTSHAWGTFNNGGRPSGVLTVSTPAADAIGVVQEGFKSQHGKPEDSGKVLVLMGDMDFKPLSMPFADSQFLEQRRYSATEIARIFRVPPSVIGADTGDSLTYATVEGQALHFVNFCLRPWLVAIEQALTADRDLFPSNHYCEFKLDGLLRADSKTRAEVYALALNPETGWMTREEVRSLENLENE